ncbi:hypothetical protein ACROYT_G002452 [Oculina patagonica]
MKLMLDKAALKEHGFKLEITSKMMTETGTGSDKQAYQKTHFYYKIVDCSQVPEVSEELEYLIPVSRSSHQGFPGLQDGNRVVKLSLTKDVPAMITIAGFECRVWYRRQPAFCVICKKLGHRTKACPMDGLCRRCRKPGHLARDCRDAWAVPRPDAPAADAPADAGPGNPDAPAADASADAGSGDPPTDEDAMDEDYVPPPDGDEFSASDESEIMSGDEEVIAAAPPPPSPRRRRRKRQHRAGAPAQKVLRESGDMDTSSGEAPNHRLFRTFREVWDDKSTWEEIRARKYRAKPPVSQEPEPPSTPQLFSDPSSGSVSTPVPPATPEPSPFSSGGSVVDSVVLEEDAQGDYEEDDYEEDDDQPFEVPDFFESLTEFCLVVPAADGSSERYDYGCMTDPMMFEQQSLAQLRLIYYTKLPEFRPPSAEPPGPVEVLPDIPPTEFPGPPPPRPFTST